MIQLAPRRTVDSPVVAMLLRGDLRELDGLAAAVQVAAAVRTSLVGCVLPGPPRAGLELLRMLAGANVDRWFDWQELRTWLTGGGVRGLLIPAETWRTAARGVWPVLEQCPLLVQRRRPPTLPRRVLAAVDSPQTHEELTRRVQALPGYPGMQVTAVYASIPAWAATLAGAMGYPVVLGPSADQPFPWPLGPGATGLCVQATPVWGIRSLAEDLRPDLVVLGVHRHRLRLPSLAHPTAWLLSHELASDVLLCPVPPGRGP